jgi:hypothetical protein
VLVAAVAKELEDGLAGVGVERTGRFVGEEEPAFADDRAGDRDSLPLATGHVVGESVGEVIDAHLLQGGYGVLAGGPGPGAVELQWERDILGRGEGGD